MFNMKILQVQLPLFAHVSIFIMKIFRVQISLFAHVSMFNLKIFQVQLSLFAHVSISRCSAWKYSTIFAHVSMFSLEIFQVQLSLFAHVSISRCSAWKYSTIFAHVSMFSLEIFRVQLSLFAHVCISRCSAWNYSKFSLKILHIRMEVQLPPFAHVSMFSMKESFLLRKKYSFFYVGLVFQALRSGVSGCFPSFFSRFKSRVFSISKFSSFCVCCSSRILSFTWPWRSSIIYYRSSLADCNDHIT